MRKTGTATLGQEGLERALHQALQAGPQSVGQQVRYILAYSQMLNLRPFPESYQRKPLTPVQSRIAALVEFAPVLTEKQARELAKEAEQIKDPAARLPLLIRLIEWLPRQRKWIVARNVWKAINELDDQVVVADLLFWFTSILDTLPKETPFSSVLPEVIELAQSIGNLEARLRSMIALATHAPEPLSTQLFQRVVDDLLKTNSDTVRGNVINAIAAQIPAALHEKLFEAADGISNPADRARVFTTMAQLFPDVDALRDTALEAIGAIRGEEERADMLAAFRPSLENATQEAGYPDVLQKALAIAVSMNRRPLRARAMVALAPFLTADLQGEALAAVHSLNNERERARLLGELAPHLPPQLIVASLAVAHTMREQDARVHALSVMAHHTPPNARSQAMIDALAAASNLPHHYERISALMALIDILPPEFQNQAFTSAVETTRLIENENARARALSLLGHHLPPHLLERALDAAYLLKDPQQRLSTLASIMPRLSEAKQHEALHTMLECARQMPFEYKRGRALISIAPHLKPEAVDEALAIASGIQEPFDKASALIALVQNIAPENRPPLIAEAWQLVIKIEDGYDRASALAAIAPHLPDTLKQHLPQIVGMIIGSIMDEYDQASAISILAPLVVDQEKQGYNSDRLPEYPALVARGVQTALNIPYQTMRVELLKKGVALWLALDDDKCYRLWEDVALRLKSLPLADVLLCLGVLMPVLHRLAGDDGITKVTHILGVQ